MRYEEQTEDLAKGVYFRSPDGDLYQAIRKDGASRYVVIKVTQKRKPDQRRKDSRYRSGYKEGVIDTAPGSLTANFVREEA